MGYEFQLQRKLYRKRSVAVEMHFISCTDSYVATLSKNFTVEFIKV